MVPSGGGDVKTSGYLMGSRRLLEEIRRREKNVPPAVAHMQDLLEHIDTNAAQIASALAASRRRRSQEGLAGVSALLQEQDKLLKEAINLVPQLDALGNLCEQLNQPPPPAPAPTAP